ncbi:uncharacterized protein [Dermacentor albipictus]|uniref:uncharacterized protein n=1 Tax=Dermacentor albipictus TaxID=60249 RepID=UPI0038FBE634
MDLLGPFLTSTSGNKLIVVATEYLNRYVEMKALLKGSAASQASLRRISACHPQANGLEKRLNKTFANMHALYIDGEHNTWETVLPYVTFAYNTPLQEETEITPFKLVHERHSTTTVDAKLRHVTADEKLDVLDNL